MSELRASGVAVRYGKTTVLDGVDFVASAGAVTAIIGPNGSGKTTLLKALTGDVPCDGRVILNGRNTGTLEPWRLADMRAVLPQSQRLAFAFTAIEVVGMGLTASRDADPAIPSRALARVGLDGYADRFVPELSGGEQQRVHLARVLAQVWTPVADDGPRWMFLDEPVASLDIAHQLEIMRIAQDYARAGGGVIAVMHDLNLTAMFAQAVTVMSGGRILEHGETRDVLTDATLGRAYGCNLRVNAMPDPGAIFVLPHRVGTATDTGARCE